MKLEALHKEIWKHHEKTVSAYAWSAETRTLTAEELAAVFQGARDGVCEVCNAVMGFGIGLHVYRVPEQPGVGLTHRVTITNKHINNKARFADGWELFYPVVSDGENQRRMEYFELEPLRDAHYYDY